MPSPILLLGTGEMAAEYVKVLLSMGMDKKEIQVVGRSQTRAELFSREYGVSCRWGGTPALLAIPAYERAIVAVSHLQLPETTLILLEKGCKSILLEKPGALYQLQLRELQDSAARGNAQIYVAFNRRFYSSINAVRDIIAEDGGLLSCNFDFTEIEDFILKDRTSKSLSDEVLARWGIVNSFHVIDLFLHLAGLPTCWTHQHGGGLSWHPGAAVFCGSGTTDRGVFFSYLATWGGAGRWRVELTTPYRKLILCPLEKLAIQSKGHFELREFDLGFQPPGLKPGIRGQLEAFFSSSPSLPHDHRLCSIDEALRHFSVAETILGYNCQ